MSNYLSECCGYPPKSAVCTSTSFGDEIWGICSFCLDDTWFLTEEQANIIHHGNPNQEDLSNE